MPFYPSHWTTFIIKICLEQDYYLGDCLRLLFSTEKLERRAYCLLPDGLDLHTPDFCLTVHQVSTTHISPLCSEAFVY
jgi:hypothetical protein